MEGGNTNPRALQQSIVGEANMRGVPCIRAKALAQPLRNLSPHATFDCDPIGTTDLARLPSQSTGGSLEALHVHVPCRLLQTLSSVPF